MVYFSGGVIVFEPSNLTTLVVEYDPPVLQTIQSPVALCQWVATILLRPAPR